MKTTKFYVTMTDKFLSGWGLAENKVNKLVIECENYDQAQKISRAASDRDEMKYVNICSKLPYYNSARYYVSNKKFSDLGGRWLTYFTNN